MDDIFVFVFVTSHHRRPRLIVVGLTTSRLGCGWPSVIKLLFILAKECSLVQAALLTLSFEKGKTGESGTSLEGTVFVFNNPAVKNKTKGNGVGSRCTVPPLNVEGTVLQLPGTMVHSCIDPSGNAVSLS